MKSNGWWNLKNCTDILAYSSIYSVKSKYVSENMPERLSKTQTVKMQYLKGSS